MAGTVYRIPDTATRKGCSAGLKEVTYVRREMSCGV